MTIAVDTNAGIALWDEGPTLSLAAQNAWKPHLTVGLWSQRLACSQSRSPHPAHKGIRRLFSEETGIGVDWELQERSGISESRGSASRNESGHGHRGPASR